MFRIYSRTFLAREAVQKLLYVDVCFSTKLAQAPGVAKFQQWPIQCTRTLPPIHLQVHSVYNTAAQFIVPDWGIKLTITYCRTVKMHRLVGRYDYLNMPLST
jgi:hypothetical protein